MLYYKHNYIPFGQDLKISHYDNDYHIQMAQPTCQCSK